MATDEEIDKRGVYRITRHRSDGEPEDVIRERADGIPIFAIGGYGDEQDKIAVCFRWEGRGEFDLKMLRSALDDAEAFPDTRITQIVSGRFVPERNRGVFLAAPWYALLVTVSVAFGAFLGWAIATF